MIKIQIWVKGGKLIENHFISKNTKMSDIAVMSYRLQQLVNILVNEGDFENEEDEKE